MKPRKLKVRPVVQRFAEAMERKLLQNDHKGGWQDEDRDWLLSRAGGELRELARAVADHDVPSRDEARDAAFWDTVRQRVLDEAADVANFVMMVADRCDALDRSPTLPRKRKRGAK